MAKVAGRHPVLELLKGGRKVHRLLVKYESSGEVIDEILAEADNKGISVEKTTEREISDLAGLENHQGVLAFADDIADKNPVEVVKAASRRGKTPRLLLLDQIQDPQNFGALIRTARAAGFQGVVYTADRSCPITPAAVKASAGAIEHISMCQVTNLNRTLQELKDEGLWIAGADPAGDSLYYETDLSGPLGIVIGSEGEGLRRLVKENCDFLVRLPVKDRPGSLNASAAAAVMIYEALRQSRENLD